MLTNIRTINLQKLADTIVGGLLVRVCSPFVQQRPVSGSRPSRIVLVKLWAMGESILTLPALRLLRRSFPRADIVVLARRQNADVYRRSDDINDVRTLEDGGLWWLIRQWRKFDLAVDAEPFFFFSTLLCLWLGRNRVGFATRSRHLVFTASTPNTGEEHAVVSYCRLVGLVTGQSDIPPALVPLRVADREVHRADEILRPVGGGGAPILAVAPGSGTTGIERRWPPARYIDTLRSVVRDTTAAIVLIGSEAEREVCTTIERDLGTPDRIVNTAGVVTLGELFAILKRCRAFLGNDSGPMHAAAAQGVHTIGIFGPNLPKRFGPYGRGNHAFYYRLSCSPCINVHLGRVPPCYNPYRGDCVRRITADMVLPTLITILTHHA